MRFSIWKERNGAKQSFAEAKQFASGKAPYNMLTIVGGVGCGKTHLATAIGWDWLEAGRLVLFYQTERLLDNLRASFDLPRQTAGEISDPTFEQRMSWIMLCDLLVLDDLGVEKLTDWARAKLDMIVDHRYLHEMAIVLTTNLGIGELPERIADRLADRQRSRIARLSCPSYRRLPPPTAKDT